MAKKLKVLIAASEVVPFAKTGGLADVAGALPKELKKLGHDVRVILPFYKETKKSKLAIKDSGETLLIEISDKIVHAKVFTANIHKNITVYLIDNPDYFDRDELYRTDEGDYPDNAERFIFFSKAVIELTKVIQFQPDIIHCNDWQTGLVPVLLKIKENENPFFANTSVVFTVHNLAYQGLFWHLDMPLTNLPWDVFTPEGIEFYGKINLMKAGMVYADVINSVSKKYSKEIQTPEFGFGLEGVLSSRAADLYGITNGVDYGEWSPEKDKFIKKKYSANDLSGKKACRDDLLSNFKLKDKKGVPVIGMISRLVDQKGFDLIADKIDKIMKLDIFLILLGTGDEKYHNLFKQIKKEYPDKVGIKLGFDNSLAHKIEAGSDIFLMPSKYEPCGLNQLYSLKYGAIPVVRATGGLDDTIKNFKPKTGKGNGFKFTAYTSNALLLKLKEALKVYKTSKDWKKLVANAMQEDYSWMQSAKEYVKLYNKAQEKKSLKTLTTV